MDVYCLGVAGAYVLAKIAPRDFDEKKIDDLHEAYNGDDEMFEAVIQEWIRQHFNYLRWYATVYLDYSVPLDELLQPPQVCHSPRRAAYERTFLSLILRACFTAGLSLTCLVEDN